MTDADLDDTDDWRRHLIDDDAGLAACSTTTRRIAVLGIKIDPEQPAYYVPEYAQRAGFEIVPVPVYYPEVTEILGEPVYRTVSAVPGDVDMVNVFRRATTFRRTSTTSSPSTRSRCGCSSAFATTTPRSDSRARASTSCRIAVCWSSCADAVARPRSAARRSAHRAWRRTSTDARAARARSTAA